MKRILVCLDSSARAPHVLDRAAAIARATGAKLVLLRAIGLPHDIPREAYGSSPNDLIEVWKKIAARELDTLAARVPKDLVDSIDTHIGTPWSAICAAAKELDVDLIAVGSHGYDALDHVLGTTAAKVVNHADRSVLVIREHAPAKS